MGRRSPAGGARAAHRRITAATVVLLAAGAAREARAAVTVLPEGAPLPRPSGAPPASQGFQMSLGWGVAFPFGDATGAPGDRLAARYAWQMPIDLALGGKVSDSVYVGGYFDVGWGAEGSDLQVEAACDDDDENLHNDVSCSALTFAFGLEARYSFAPAERWNPWLGYGIGFESAEESLEDRPRGYRESQTSTGYTLARLTGGVDFRGAIGFGPYATLAVGRFTRAHTAVNDVERFRGDVDDPSFHEWLTIGLRGVLFP